MKKHITLNGDARKFESFGQIRDFFTALKNNSLIESDGYLLLGKYQRLPDLEVRAGYSFVVFYVDSDIKTSPAFLGKLNVFNYISIGYKNGYVIILPMTETLESESQNESVLTVLESLTKSVCEYFLFDIENGMQQVDTSLKNSLNLQSVDFDLIQTHSGGLEFSYHFDSKIKTSVLAYREFENVHSKQALDFIQAYFDGHVISTDKSFYCYSQNNGLWEVKSISDMKAYLYNHVFRSDVLPKYALEPMFNAFKLITHQANFPTYSGSHNNILILRNGVLIPASNRFSDFHPYYFGLQRLDYEYDPNAQCELWLKTLNYYFEFDNDREQKISFLQEAFGLSLTNISSFQIMFFLLGEGSNGKSVITNLLTQLIGEHHVSTVSLVDFAEQFSLNEMAGKLANIDPDIEKKSMKREGKVKSIISSERLTVQRKYKSANGFKPQVKLWACGNELPESGSNSHGYYRRFGILKFNRKIEGKDKNLKLLDELLEERSGILNWALEGLERLLKNQEFTMPESSVEELKRYESIQNSMQRFLDEKLVLTDGNAKSGRTDRSKIYAAFYEFLSEELRISKIPPEREFYKEMEKLGVKSGKSNTRYFCATLSEDN